MTRILEICTFVRLSSNAQLPVGWWSWALKHVFWPDFIQTHFRFYSNSFQIFWARKTSPVYPGLNTSDLTPRHPSWVERPGYVIKLKCKMWWRESEKSEMWAMWSAWGCGWRGRRGLRCRLLRTRLTRSLRTMSTMQRVLLLSLLMMARGEWSMLRLPIIIIININILIIIITIINITTFAITRSWYWCLFLSTKEGKTNTLSLTLYCTSKCSLIISVIITTSSYLHYIIIISSSYHHHTLIKSLYHHNIHIARLTV